MHDQGASKAFHTAKKLTEVLLRAKGCPTGLRLIIAFDESDIITRRQKGASHPPPFSSLTFCLSYLIELPIYTLFLSTTGDIAPFTTPNTLPDASSRLLLGTKKLSPSFTGCPFDVFSHLDKDRVEGKVTIDHVAKEWAMAHLGRPLYVRVTLFPEKAC